MKKQKPIKVELIYKSPANDGNFRLSKALSILVSKEDLVRYLEKKGRRNPKKTRQ